MPTYSLHLIPLDRMVFAKPVEWMPDGATPWAPWGGAGYHDTSGGNWNQNGPWSFTFDRADLVKVDIHDIDDHLDDDTFWQEGPGLQTIQTAVGSAQPGYDVTDEYELNFTAEIDGQTVTYRLVAIAAMPPGATVVQTGNFIGFTFEGAWPPPGAVLTYVPGSNADHEVLHSGDMQVPCFTRGTLIATPEGARRIQTLQVGDLVLTRDHGAQPIRWIGSRSVPALGALAPVRVAPGVLGNERALKLSPHHRLLVEDGRLELISDSALGLIEVRHLINGSTVRQVEGGEVEYFHILFDAHEVIFAEGVPVESLLLGPMTGRVMSRDALAELRAVFPDLAARLRMMPAAWPLLDADAARLVAGVAAVELVPAA